MKDLKAISRYFLIYGTALIYLELLLRFLMDGGVSPGFLFFLCFIPAQASGLILFNGFFRDRGNIVVSSLLLLAVGFYYISQLIYYKNFGSLFSASLMGMGAQAMGNFGWTIIGVIKSNLPWIFLMLLPAFAAGGVSFFRVLKQEKISVPSRLILLALTVPLWFLGVLGTRIDGTGRQSAYRVYHDILSDTDNTAGHLGALTTTLLELGAAHKLNEQEMKLAYVDMGTIAEPENSGGKEEAELSGNPESGEVVQGAEEPVEEPLKPRAQILEEIDLAQLAEKEEDGELRELSLYLNSRGATETNEYTGLFEGYNLIYICAEAFWTYAIDSKVTPTLAKMADKGIILNNYYNSFRNTTTNGEFAFATGIWPDISRKADAGADVGSFPQSAKCYMPMGLGHLFENMGVPAYAYHNYYGGYYNRDRSWPNLGYTCKFYRQGMDFTTLWPASDIELMEQSVDDYIDDERFHAYYMTFSGHGPYSLNNEMCLKNYEYVKANMKEGYHEEVYCYLAGNRELDLAMEYLLKRLEEAGKLEKTVIVIAGDHYPYNLSREPRDQLGGGDMDEDFKMYKSACIIYNAGMEENIVSDTYCSNVDILPTMLNLFGVEFDSRLMMGRDVFSKGLHKAVIYNKSFINDMVQYDAKTGETVWSDKAADRSEEWKKQYLETMSELIDSEYYASIRIMDLNYYLYVWYNSGLMTEEELAEEKKRAEHIRALETEERERLEREAQERAEAEAAAAAEGTVQDEAPPLEEDPGTGTGGL